MSAKRSDLTFEINKYKNFPEWYEEILQLASIVDKRTTMKGITVMPPYGCFIHTAIMQHVEKEWIKQGISYAQFPTLIPEPLLTKEEDHLAGFAPEVFWVTKGGTADITPRLALRPTSETIMYSTFANWVQSYRDLPIKVQQSCQVFRCETKDTLPLIRAREIYWNEAHCCHASAEEAEEQCRGYWVGYRHVFDNVMGVPGLYIRRPPWDTFPGAVYTDVIDVITPTGRVLQAASAHFLGTGFSRIYGVTFSNKEAEAKKSAEKAQPKEKKPKEKKQKGKKKEGEGEKKEGEPAEKPTDEATSATPSTPESSAATPTPTPSAPSEPVLPEGMSYGYMNCAGISTRGLAAALITHGDDHGLVLPHLLAPVQIVLVPILKGKEDVDTPLMNYVREVDMLLQKEGEFRTKVDDGPGKPGPKFFHWEMKGVPCRLEIGPRDMEGGAVMCLMRNQTKEQKDSIKLTELIQTMTGKFATYHQQLFTSAVEWHVRHVEKFQSVDFSKGEFSLDDLKNAFDKDDLSKPCVFRIPFMGLRDPDAKEGDKKIRDQTGLEVRGYDINDPVPPEGTKCIASGKKAECWVYVARSY